MVAQLEAPYQTLSRADIIDRVQRQIAAGKQPNEAFAAIYEEIDAAGDLEALARLHGVNLVGNIWREWNISNRPSAVARTAKRPIQASHLVTPTDQERAEPFAGRVFDPAPLRATAMLDAQYKVDGCWVMLRHMDRALCHKVAKSYQASVRADEHNRRYFLAIEAALSADQTVGQAFTEAKLLRLYKISEPKSRQIEVD